MVGLLIGVYVVNVMKEMVGLLYGVSVVEWNVQKGGVGLVSLRPREDE